MDPLTALGLAASIAQFIDFGSNLVGKTREIAKAGSSVSVDHLSTLTSNLVDINKSLKYQVGLSKAGNGMPTQEEQALHDLINQCNDVAQELTRSLASLTVDKRQRKRTWASVQAALKTILSKEHIDVLARRLSDFREQLTLRVLLLLNAQVPSQGSKLDASKNEIVEVVSLNHDSLKAVIESRYQTEKKRRRDERIRAEERHIETIAAILTTREGNSRTIIGLRGGPRSSSPLNPELSQTATTYTQAEDKGRGHSGIARQPATFGSSGFEGITKRILEALHFRSINERRSAISKAHQRTFQWIYHDKVSQESSWDDFPQWLTNGKGCYWINGKAGSGKSTLMKYILENQKTTDALVKWSDSSDLIVASFFFWYAGTPLQKSQVGLLRALLLDVLNRRPGLAPVLFPGLYRSLISKEVFDNIDITYNELRSAFLTLCSSIPEGLKICFVIDGIDEYEGDHYEISELFSHVADFESIKILLSSRPIPDCIHAFSRFPKLRLQDLTHDDIMHYIEDKLGGDSLMQRLDQAQNGATEQLIEGVTSKASGVFLWVVLVVKRLLSGLRDYDTLSDLIQKLDELPGDLEALYDHMLGDMSSQNRLQGSKMLQLVLRSSETHGDIPMTVLQLSFAEEEEYSTSKIHKASKICSRELEWRCEATEGRMRSRCCGLIEVQEPPARLEAYKARKIVGFLHRTVVDFLHSRTVWTYLVSLTSDTKFDVNQALLNSTLAEMIVQSQSSRESPKSTHAVYSMLRFMAYERCMEDMIELLMSKYIPALKTIMATVWLRKDLFESPDVQHEAVTGAADRTCALYDINGKASLVLLAATHCPREPLRILLDGLYPADNEARFRQAVYLLTQFMEETEFPVRMLTVEAITTCAQGGRDALRKEFLDQGLYCDEDFIGHADIPSLTIPKLVLNYAYRLTKLSDDSFFKTYSLSCFFDLWIAMLEAGIRADLFFTVKTEDNFGRGFEYESITAWKVVQALMLRIRAGLRDAQAPSNKISAGAQLLDLDPSFIDGVAAKCCRIDELSMSTCGNSRFMFADLAGDGVADAASVDIDHAPTRGSKRHLELSEISEANKRA